MKKMNRKSSYRYWMHSVPVITDEYIPYYGKRELFKESFALSKTVRNIFL